MKKYFLIFVAVLFLGAAQSHSMDLKEIHNNNQLLKYRMHGMVMPPAATPLILQSDTKKAGDTISIENLSKAKGKGLLWGSIAGVGSGILAGGVVGYYIKSTTKTGDLTVMLDIMAGALGGAVTFAIAAAVVGGITYSLVKSHYVKKFTKEQKS